MNTYVFGGGSSNLPPVPEGMSQEEWQTPRSCVQQMHGESPPTVSFQLMDRDEPPDVSFQPMDQDEPPTPTVPVTTANTSPKHRRGLALLRHSHRSRRPGRDAGARRRGLANMRRNGQMNRVELVFSGFITKRLLQFDGRLKRSEDVAPGTLPMRHLVCDFLHDAECTNANPDRRALERVVESRICAAIQRHVDVRAEAGEARRRAQAAKRQIVRAGKTLPAALHRFMGAEGMTMIKQKLLEANCDSRVSASSLHDAFQSPMQALVDSRNAQADIAAQAMTASSATLEQCLQGMSSLDLSSN